MPRPSIGIVIVSYNTRNQLRRCLDSLGDWLDQVVVFDNHSSDQSALMVQAEFPAVRVIESAVNLGYGTAANRAVLSGPLQGAEIWIVANADLVFQPGAVAQLAADLQAAPDAAVCGPRLLNPDGTLQRSCFPWPGSLRWAMDNDVVAPLLRAAGLARKHFLRLWDHDTDRTVPWVLGAVLAVRQDAFEQVGGFDESFFMYYEETDLCFRLAQLGWRTRFTPRALVVHEGGASTRAEAKEMARELHRSFLRFARRHYGPFRFAALWCLWQVIGRARRTRAA